MALLAVSGSCMAQARFNHKAHRLELRGAQVKKQCRPTDARNLVAGKSGGSIFLPTHEATYAYDGAEWMEDASYTYRYDSKGNVLSQIVDDGVSKTKSVYEYNADGMETKELTMVDDGAGGFANSGKLEQKYDKVVKDFVVSSFEYAWNSTDWNMVDMGRTWERSVGRNDQGNVTGVTTNTYHAGMFEELMKTSVTYGPDGKADTWRYDELVYDGVNDPAMEEFYTLRNMEWENTDGQVVIMDLNDFYTGNNRLKSAIVVEPGEVQAGNILADYKDNGDYSYMFYYNGTFDGDGYSKTFIDGNGSYEEESAYYFDANLDGLMTEDEKQSGMTAKVVFDDHGNVVSETIFEDGEMVDGMKYEYTYAPEYDYPTEQVYYGWNPDLMDYEPFIKIVSTDFTDVTTSISEVETSRGEDATAVYNTQGVKVGTSTDALPKGLYIVKSGGKTKKMMKR